MRKSVVYYEYSVRDIAQPGLARLTGGQKVRSSNLRIPTIFFALIPRQKKHEAVRLRFIFCGSAAKCFIKKTDDEALFPSSFHYAATSHFIPI